MSGQRAALPAGRNGLLLRGGRTRSYGSLVRASLSSVRQRHIEHSIQPGETLQGLALKYGVSMEQIKRANRLYTNDSIFLKKSLSIPVLPDLHDCSTEDSSEESEESEASAAVSTATSDQLKRDDARDPRVSDLTPVDFLKRLDGLINQSKQAAFKGCQDAEKRVADLEAACCRTSEWRPLTRSQSVVVSSSAARHRPVPITITEIAKKLRDMEDEIFEL